MKTAIVMGAGGFIGSHMVKRLKSEGYWVFGIDLKSPEFSQTECDTFEIKDLRDPSVVMRALDSCPTGRFDEIYQYAADMGGAGYIFTGEHDVEVMHNSATINLNLVGSIKRDLARYLLQGTKVFYSSSACMYPAYNQGNADSPDCRESSAYPAEPDSEYGWEKLFSERLFQALQRNCKIPVAIGRFHNIYGREGTWDGGREKAPAAICRKVASASEGGEIEIWGDGKQTRSFLYIDDCIEATRRLMMCQDFFGPVNIGSEEMISISDLVTLTARVAGKNLHIRSVDGPMGVRGRNSNNDLIRASLNWEPSISLEAGIRQTYFWITEQLAASKTKLKS